MAQRISTVSGVAQVQVFGSQKYAVRLQVDPLALATKGIGIDEVADAVRAANVNLPTGTLWGASQAVTVQAAELPQALATGVVNAFMSSALARRVAARSRATSSLTSKGLVT